MDGLISVPVPKRHAACDTCRTLKLKCSGEPEGCGRCRREALQCLYSQQKQMGRPRKRRRDGTQIPTPAPNGAPGMQPELVNMSSFSGPASSLSANATSGDDEDFALGLLDVPFQSDNGSNQYDFTQLSGLEERSYSSPFATGVGAQPAGVIDQPIGMPVSFPTAGVPLIDDTCACLANAYLALSNLQTIKNLPFPVTLQPLRSAISVVGDMLDCEQCLKEQLSATQNTMLVGTLLTSIAQHVKSMLKSIHAEAESAEAACTTKRFRMGDTSQALAPFHTGTAECPAAFFVELEAKEWRLLAKKAVSSVVMVSVPGKRSIVDLIKLVEERHDACALQSEKDCAHSDISKHRELRKEDHLCIRIVRVLQDLVQSFEWT